MARIPRLTRHDSVAAQFAEHAGLDRILATLMLESLAEDAGTSVVEAAVVSVRTLELADRLEPGRAVDLLQEVAGDLQAGRLMFPRSRRPLSASCHPIQAMRVAVAVLEWLRPDYFEAVGAVAVIDEAGRYRHLTLVHDETGALPPPA